LRIGTQTCNYSSTFFNRSLQHGDGTVVVGGETLEPREMMASVLPDGV